MNGVWGNYGLARTAYIASQTIKGMSHAQAVEKYHTKSLVGNWTYTFQINPEVVTVNEEILLDTARWRNLRSVKEPAAQVQVSSTT